MEIKDLQTYLISKLQRNVSQTDLAHALEINKASVSSRFKRNSELSFEDKKKIEQYFGISLNEFKQNEECVTLEHIHINPSCGKGTAVVDNAEITPIALGKQLIQNIFKISDTKNLKVFIASGDSMKPTIEHGDSLLVDISDTEFANGGVFLITVNNDWFIKRLHKRITGEIDIISDNSKYQTETLKHGDFKEISIKGRVVKNLSRGL